MSRIREALTKIEGGTRPVPPAPEVAPPASQYATARELEPRRYERPAYLEPVEPVYEAAPAYEAPALPEAPQAEGLPGIPGEFHRELAALRHTLEAALPGRATRVVQFAAAVGGEGTTTVAANFARVLAQDATQSVLLVDANVRRPGLALFFGLAEQPGLRELIDAGAIAETERYLQAAERPNLHVLAATEATGDLAQVYAPEALREFWARVGRNYHWVIVDGAPVNEAPETAIVGGTVDTTVIVIQAARTKRGVVQRAMERCAKAGAPVLGAVLNRRRLDIPEFIYRRI
jgi:capsular exopolysaccharide synthesis family protein